MTAALVGLAVLAGALAVAVFGLFLLVREQWHRAERLDMQCMALRIVIQTHGSAELQRAAGEALNDAEEVCRKQFGARALYHPNLP